MSSLDKFNSWGLSFSKPSDTQPELPYDITDIDSEALGKLFTELTAWADYAASQLTMAQLDERSILKEKEFKENTMLVKRMGAQAKGERVTTVKAEIAIDPEIHELDIAYEEKYAYRKYVEMILTNQERNLSLVSREITRRSNDLRSTRKEYN